MVIAVLRPDNRRFLLPRRALVDALAAAALVACGDGTGGTNIEVPPLEISPTGHDLFGIWGSATDDAWVVGNAGVILHGTK